MFFCAHVRLLQLARAIIAAQIQVLCFAAGMGQQTLGEEYCDLLQTSANHLAPAVQQRAAQVLLHAILPVVQAKLATLQAAQEEQADSGAAEGSTQLGAVEKLPQNSPHCGAAGHRGSAHDSSQGVIAPAPRRLARFTWRAALPPPPHAIVQLQAAWGYHARRLWAQRWHAAARCAAWAPLLAQLHLALFYLFGVYFELPKRATGARMTYIGTMNVARKYYGVMGALLLLQLATRVAARLRCGLWHVLRRCDAAIVHEHQPSLVWRCWYSHCMQQHV